jgi:hypothetical protein
MTLTGVTGTLIPPTGTARASLASGRFGQLRQPHGGVGAASLPRKLGQPACERLTAQDETDTPVRITRGTATLATSRDRKHASRLQETCTLLRGQGSFLGVPWFALLFQTISATEDAPAMAAPVESAAAGLHVCHSHPVRMPAGIALMPTMKL